MSISSPQAGVKKSTIANVLNTSVDSNPASILSCLTSYFPNPSSINQITVPILPPTSSSSTTHSPSSPGTTTLITSQLTSKEMLNSSSGDTDNSTMNTYQQQYNLPNQALSHSSGSMNGRSSSPPSPSCSSPHSSDTNNNSNSNQMVGGMLMGNQIINSLGSSSGIGIINNQVSMSANSIQHQPTQPIHNSTNKHQPQQGYQTCSHVNHEAWWGTSPDLPISEFYTRSYKCKKCYIKQQTESKKSRSKDSPNDSNATELSYKNSGALLNNLASVSQIFTDNPIIQQTAQQNPGQKEKKPSKYLKKKQEALLLKQFQQQQQQQHQTSTNSLIDSAFQAVGQQDDYGQDTKLYPGNNLKTKHNLLKSDYLQDQGVNSQKFNSEYLFYIDPQLPDDKKLEIFNRFCKTFRSMIGVETESNGGIDINNGLSGTLEDTKHNVTLHVKGRLRENSSSIFFTELSIDGRICKGCLFEDSFSPSNPNKINNNSNSNNNINSSDNNISKHHTHNNNNNLQGPMGLISQEKELLTTSTNSENLQALLTLGKSDELKKRKLDPEDIESTNEQRKKILLNNDSNSLNHHNNNDNNDHNNNGNDDEDGTSMDEN
ncbi:protein kinase [Tieghemostelium lacteum]|uniref:Protein kinase n=1 Tax=Tieghemostelium lacteum TaxID=361077 RepID=A0A151Z8Z0_TIELA|nr:protein kinase [Tieghemostelium lacteum]|eukprot:KYQ90412.1 protein kinase [Tieghemostelium lacteum]